MRVPLSQPLPNHPYFLMSPILCTILSISSSLPLSLENKHVKKNNRKKKKQERESMRIAYSFSVGLYNELR